MADLNRIKAWANQAKAKSTDNAVYQSIIGLIDFVQNITDGLQTSVTKLNNSVFGSGGGGPAGISGAPFLTHDVVNLALLPNFRELLAGTNITFNDATANQRTISATSGVTSIADDNTYVAVTPDPIVTTGTISITNLSKAAIDGANHALFGGM